MSGIETMYLYYGKASLYSMHALRVMVDSLCTTW